MGDPLEGISQLIDFEMFRPILNGVFKREGKCPGERPAFDHILMFKILLLQQWYCMADDKTEYQ
ncbi:MAG: IS5/IS1182 family transposase, partial [Desulfovibrio sp.]|nr:IS5/IS1182 family transposase [Desulfovibrio sp.]